MVDLRQDIKAEMTHKTGAVWSAYAGTSLYTSFFRHRLWKHFELIYGELFISIDLDSAASISQRYENLLKKEVRTHLHGSTLAHDWRNWRIPRGPEDQ